MDFLAGKTLTKQLMVAVESALQKRFGSHAGWAHNTLFISELASQRHILPLHLHPGARGKAARKAGGAPDRDAAAEVAAPVTPPQQLDRGKRSAARAKRAAVDASTGDSGIAQHHKAALQAVESDTLPYSIGSAGRREPSQQLISPVGPVVKVESEQLPQSVGVSDAVENAAMEGFAEVRRIEGDVGCTPCMSEAAGEQTVSVSKSQPGRRKARRVSLIQ